MVLFATGAVIIGVLVFAAVVNLVSTRKDTGKVGTDLYIVGDADSLARSVSRDGPLLLPDLLGSSRDIYVQHVAGEDWRTFEAHAPGAARKCVLKWEAAARHFTDPCTPGVTYPADGSGLTTFPTSVDPDGRLVVDLRQPQAPTTVAPTTTSTGPTPAPAP